MPLKSAVRKRHWPGGRRNDARVRKAAGYKKIVRVISAFNSPPLRGKLCNKKL
jgi:hypothetical protein